jgi:hypothetical protein
MARIWAKKKKKKKDTCIISMAKPLEKHLLGTQRWRWKSNTKIDLGEIGCGDGRWVELAQDHFQWQTLVLLVLNLWDLLPQC